MRDSIASNLYTAWAIDLRNELLSVLSRRHAGKQQAFHIAPAVADLLERIMPAKALDREIGLERQQLTDVELGLVTLSEVTERGNQRLIAGDEIGIGFHDPPPHHDRPLVIATEGISYREHVLKIRG